MLLRILKIANVAAIGFLLSLFVFDNLSDYNTNFQFVRHVLSMDTIHPEAAIGYRAITSPAMHHLAYGLIIATQAAAACLCWLGASRMWRLRKASAGVFRLSKQYALAGLALGAMLYLLGFIAIGGEWFGMWMSASWNGVASAFRFFICIFAVMVFVAMRDDEQLA